MKTKKINVWVFVFALVMAGVCSQQVRGGALTKNEMDAALDVADKQKKETADELAATRAADAASALANTPEPTVDATAAASSAGVSWTTQISNMVSKITTPFKNAFNSLKTALGSAVDSMKTAFGKVKNALDAQIKVVKDMVSKLAGVIVQIYPIVEKMVTGKEGTNLSKKLDASKDKTALTDAEKLQLAQAFVEASKTSVAGLLTLVVKIFEALPTSIKTAEANKAKEATQGKVTDVVSELKSAVQTYIDNTKKVSDFLALPNPAPAKVTDPNGLL